MRAFTVLRVWRFTDSSNFGNWQRRVRTHATPLEGSFIDWPTAKSGRGCSGKWLTQNRVIWKTWRSDVDWHNMQGTNAFSLTKESCRSTAVHRRCTHFFPRLNFNHWTRKPEISAQIRNLSSSKIRFLQERLIRELSWKLMSCKRQIEGIECIESLHQWWLCKQFTIGHEIRRWLHTSIDYHWDT